jgi:hypothetical protein
MHGRTPSRHAASHRALLPELLTALLTALLPPLALLLAFLLALASLATPAQATPRPAAPAGQGSPQEQMPGQPSSSAPGIGGGTVTLKGTVRNGVSGDPIARALVQIEGDANTGTLTDGEGRFELPGVAAGPQVIRLAKPGFRDRAFANDDGGLQAEGAPHSVLISAQMPELAFTLTPDCAIHGHIELSTGDPADGIVVWLAKREIHLGRSTWVGEIQTRANGDGSYRFGNLPPGSYVVYTEPSLESEPAVSSVAAGSAARVARSGYPMVFYPDARDLAGASRIQLADGAQAEANLALNLEPFYPVTAVDVSRAHGARGGRHGGYNTSVLDSSGQALPYPVQYDDATHTLQANLPDGSYTMVVRAFGRPEIDNLTGAISLQQSGAGSDRVILAGAGSSSAGAVEFTVAGHAVSGLRVALGPQPPLTVRLRVDHSAQSSGSAQNDNGVLSSIGMTLDPVNGVPRNGYDSLYPTEAGRGVFTYTGGPGAYWVNANIQQGLCVGSFNAGGLNPARDPLVLSLASAPPPIELTLTDDCARLTLTLPPALMSVVSGEEPELTVYVVPDFDTVQNLPPMTMRPSSGGTLALNGLTPGSYHVYAFNSPVSLEYRNPAALAAVAGAGKPVTLNAGATATLMLEEAER